MKTRSFVTLLAVCAELLLFGSAFAAEPPKPAPIREVSPGIYEVGVMRLDQKTRTLTMPVRVNMIEGPLEYLLVTEQGSAHESLLVSDVQPIDVHVAMLLLGAKGAPTGPGGALPPAQIDAQYLKTAPKLGGESVSLVVRWKDGEGFKTTPVEDWIFNTEAKKPMERGPWTYNGSMFNDGLFLAQVEGAFAALVIYPAALINNPRKGDDNDQIWEVNTKVIPPVKTPLDLIITLLPSSKP